MRRLILLVLCAVAWAQEGTVQVGNYTALNVTKLASDPSPCNAGQIWYNTTSNLYKFCPAGTVTTIGTGSGIGTVIASGTPLVNQVALWVNATTIRGLSSLFYDGTTFIGTGTGGASFPTYTATGAGAGLTGWTQGADNSSNCPVNSRCYQAPTSIATSWTETGAGAGPAVAGVKLYSALSSAKTTESFSTLSNAAGTQLQTSTGTLALNALGKFNSSGDLISSSVTDDGTTVISTDTGGIQSGGKVAAATNGTNTGIIQIPGNVTNPVPAANTFNLFGPASASFTGYAWQYPIAENGSAGLTHVGASASHISALTVSPVVDADFSGQLAAAHGGTGLSSLSTFVLNNAANTGTAAMTLDMSASTVANAHRVPIGAGLTAGADGAIAYDTTAKSTHVRTNSADSVVGAFASAPVGSLCVHTSGTTGLLTEAAADCGTGSGGTGPLFTSTADATVTNTTTETSVTGTGVGSKTTAANYFVAGTTLQLWQTGYFSSAVTDTLNIKIKAGSTVVGATGAVTNGVQTNSVFRLIAYVTCRTTGVSGTFQVNTVLETTGSALTPNEAKVLNPSTVTLDTTGTLAWDVTATWGTAAVADTITGTNFVMFSPNASVSTRQAIVTLFSTTTPPQNSTKYFAVIQGSTAAGADMLSPVTGTISEMYCAVIPAPASGQSHALTAYYDDATTTTATCTVTGTAQSCSVTGLSVAITLGHKLAIQDVVSATAGSGTPRCDLKVTGAS